MAEGEQQIEAPQAREFVSAFVPDPKMLESMDDAGVLGYHTRISQALDKVRPVKPWADNWRDELAKGADGKPIDAVAKRLARYTDPKAVANALVSVQERISAGELRSNMPKDATPEQMTAWRVENGVPETPDKYDLKLPQGMTIVDIDKPILDSIFKELHPKGFSNAMASDLVAAYYKTQSALIEQGKTQQADRLKQVDDQLHSEWGNDYRANQNLIAAVINEKVPAGSKLGERLNDAVKSDPEFARFMAAVARTINPVSTIIPGANSESMPQAIESEISAIVAEMKKGPESKYYKGSIVERNGRKDTEMAIRYQELLEAQARAKG